MLQYIFGQYDMFSSETPPVLTTNEIYVGIIVLMIVVALILVVFFSRKIISKPKCVAVTLISSWVLLGVILNQVLYAILNKD